AFRVRARPARPLSVNLNGDQPPRKSLGSFNAVEAGPDWTDISDAFVATGTASEAVLRFNLGGVKGDVEFAAISLTPVSADNTPASAKAPRYSVSYSFNDHG